MTALDFSLRERANRQKICARLTRRIRPTLPGYHWETSGDFAIDRWIRQLSGILHRQWADYGCPDQLELMVSGSPRDGKVGRAAAPPDLVGASVSAKRQDRSLTNVNGAMRFMT